MSELKKIYTAPALECLSLMSADAVAALRPVESEIELTDNSEEE